MSGVHLLIRVLYGLISGIRLLVSSAPSYRYAYFLWFVLIALFAIYAAAHQLGFRGGFLGSAWSKLAIRRRVLRSKKSKRNEMQGSGGRSYVLPSISQIFCIVIVAVLAALLCVIGDDYINPYTGVWDLSTSFAKRAAATFYQTPAYNISKTWWTSGARFGLIAFALFPLVVLFALKAPPFAILAISVLTDIHSDKLALLHRWTGRIIWLITALHVALWTVQLFIDERGNGENRKMWFVVWIYSKYIWAVVAFVGMTGLIALSIKSVRKRFYEVSITMRSQEKASPTDALYVTRPSMLSTSCSLSSHYLGLPCTTRLCGTGSASLPFSGSENASIASSA